MRAFQVVEEVIYCVTKSKGSLTANVRTEIIDERLKVLIDRSNFLKRNITPDQYKSLNITGEYILMCAKKGKMLPQKRLNICVIMIKNGIKPFEMKKILKLYKIRKVIRRIKEEDLR